MVNDLLSFGIPKISFPAHFADFFLEMELGTRLVQ